MSFRDRIDPEALLKALGIQYERNGLSLRALCPNPDHADTNPSWSIVDAPGTRKHCGHLCMSCKFGGGPWELVMAVRGVDEDAAFEFVGAVVSGQPRRFEAVPRVVVQLPRRAAPFALPPQVRIPSLDGTEWPEPFSKYLLDRGVTAEQTERWRIGFATRGVLAWRVVIPVHTRGELVAYTARAIFNDRERYHMPRERDGACLSSAIFGEALIHSPTKILTIAEGVFSALALERAGAPNPVALLGSDWATGKATILGSVPWESVLIATDPDPAGDRVARAIAASFRDAKILRLRWDRSPDDMESDRLRETIAEALRPGGVFPGSQLGRAQPTPEKAAWLRSTSKA